MPNDTTSNNTATVTPVDPSLDYAALQSSGAFHITMDRVGWCIREEQRQSGMRDAPPRRTYVCDDGTSFVDWDYDLPWPSAGEDARKMPVWQDERWWWRDTSRRHKFHFVHVSRVDPRLIAYTPNADKGARDIQVRIKPGAYLKKFFGDILTDKQIAFYADWHRMGSRPSKVTSGEVAFAHEADDMVRVYQTGPHSCMRLTDKPVSAHPVRVFSAGDLALAYLTRDDGRVMARALVWPKNKVFGRIYPTVQEWKRDQGDMWDTQEECQDWHDALKMGLRNQGYVHDDDHDAFDGARLARIEVYDGTYLMPWMDYNYGVYNDGDYWRMVPRGWGEGNGGQPAQNLSGTITEQPEYDYECERCGDGMNGDEAYEVYTYVAGDGSPRGIETWCEGCHHDSAFFCHGVGEYISDNVEDAILDGETVSSCYAEHHGTYSTYSDEYHTGPMVEMANGETWSADEFEEHGFTCVITGDNYPNTEMHPAMDKVWRDANLTDYAAPLPCDPDDPRQMAFALVTTSPDNSEAA